MQWLQDPKQKNAENPNNARREASRYFRNKKKEYLKGTIDEFETNRINQNIRDLYRGHQ
jgi:hypothetical protein